MLQVQTHSEVSNVEGPVMYNRHRDNPQLQPALDRYARLQSSLHEVLIKPRTRKGQMYCWLSWVGIVAFVAIVFWQALPRIVDHGENA